MFSSSSIFTLIELTEVAWWADLGRLSLMICCGVSLTYLIGAFVNWRVLALIGTLPCAAQIFGLFFIPESPRWLAKIGQQKESEAALQHLRGKNVDISGEAAEIRSYTETLKHLSEASVLDLFQRRYAHSLLVGVGLMVLQQFGGVNGITFYASTIFVSAGFSNSVGTIAMVVVQIWGSFDGKIMTTSTFSGTCLGCLFVGLIVYAGSVRSLAV